MDLLKRMDPDCRVLVPARDHSYRPLYRINEEDVDWRDGHYTESYGHEDERVIRAVVIE